MVVRGIDAYLVQCIFMLFHYALKFLQGPVKVPNMKLIVAIYLRCLAC